VCSEEPARAYRHDDAREWKEAWRGAKALVILAVSLVYIHDKPMFVGTALLLVYHACCEVCVCVHPCVRACVSRFKLCVWKRLRGCSNCGLDVRYVAVVV